jgi:hypothetical protein
MSALRLRRAEVGVIALVARAWPWWAKQTCERCHRTEPIDHLVPVLTNNVLTGWVCEWEGCNGRD